MAIEVGALLGAAPTIVAAVSQLGRGLEWRTRKHVELLKELPDDVDSAELIQLVNEELAEIASKARGQLRRKIHWAGVAALIIMGLVLGGVVYAGWWGASLVPLTWLRWVLRFLDVTLAVIFAMAMVIALPSTLFKGDEEPKDSAL